MLVSDGAHPRNRHPYGGWCAGGDVMQQFLIEAVLVCLMGGAIGPGFLYSIAFAAKMALPDWEFVFRPAAIVSAVLC